MGHLSHTCTEFMSGDTFYRSSFKLISQNYEQRNNLLRLINKNTYNNSTTKTMKDYDPSTFSFNMTKENESTEIIFSFGERMSFNQCRCVGVKHRVNRVKLFFMMFPFNYRYFPQRMNFCNKSQTPNKIPLIILSRKHVHYEYFSSLSFLWFNNETLCRMLDITSKTKRFQKEKLRMQKMSSYSSDFQTLIKY